MNATRTLLPYVSGLLCFVSASLAGAAPIVVRPADLIFINGRIHLDPDNKQSVVQALSIRNGDVASTGNTARILTEKTDLTRVIDLKGKAVLPGFHDGSMRMIEGGLSLTGDEGREVEVLKKAFLRAQEAAIQAGITSVSGPVTAEEVYIIRDLAKSRQLMMRYELWGDLEKLDEYLKNRESFKDSVPAELARFGGVVGTLDGDLLARSAALTEPYKDNPSVQGMPRYSQDKLNSLVIAANRAGIPVILRASGDKAVNMAISAFGFARKTLFNSRIRNRIEGADLVTPAVRGRLADLGISVIVHPNRLASNDGVTGELRALLNNRLGARRAEGAFAWKSLMNAKVRLVLASDWPNGKLEPLIGLVGAIFRADGHASEAFTLQEALNAYTLNPAYVMREEHVKGSIREGKWADLVVIDRDPFQVRPGDLQKLKVQMTVSAGRVVYDATAKQDVPLPPATTKKP